MNKSFRTVVLSLLLLTVVTLGCGQPRPKGMPRLYSATITVLQENQPLSGVVVQLFPEDLGIAQWGPAGTTDERGVAVLRTNGLYVGAPIGTYKVTLSKIEAERHPNPELANLPDDDPRYKQFLREVAKLKVYSYVEPVYGNLETTPITVEIVDNNDNNQTVDAGKKYVSSN